MLMEFIFFVTMLCHSVYPSDPGIHVYICTYVYICVYICIYTCLPFLMLPSIVLYAKRLDVAACAAQSDLIAYPFCK